LIPCSIERPPTPNENTNAPQMFLAATAHKLANDYGHPPPSWVFDKRCYLPGSSPFFDLVARRELALSWKHESPSEFKHHNLFVNARTLLRA
jgi:hypothetical protein